MPYSIMIVNGSLTRIIIWILPVKTTPLKGPAQRYCVYRHAYRNRPITFAAPIYLRLDRYGELRAKAVLLSLIGPK